MKSDVQFKRALSTPSTSRRFGPSNDSIIYCSLNKQTLNEWKEEKRSYYSSLRLNKKKKPLFFTALIVVVAAEFFKIYFQDEEVPPPSQIKLSRKYSQKSTIFIIYNSLHSLTPLVHGTNIGIVTSLTDFYRSSSIVKVESASYRWWASGAVCFWNEFSSIGIPFCARCLMKIETPQRWERKAIRNLVHT